MKVPVLTLILMLACVWAEEILSLDGEVIIPDNYSLYYRSETRNKLD